MHVYKIGEVVNSGGRKLVYTLTTKNNMAEK
jgi:hypothetical protein